MQFVGVVSQILSQVPFAISMVERFLGSDSGARKQLSAGREVIEFIRELVKQNPADEWAEVDAPELKSLLNALEDEEGLTKRVVAVNDAVVELVNFINAHQPPTEVDPPF